MTYDYFLEHIDDYVGHVVVFTNRIKANGMTGKAQRYVWDNKEFGALREDSLIEVLNVEDIGAKKTLSIPSLGIHAV